MTTPLVKNVANIFQVLISVLIIFLLAACEKPIIEEYNATQVEGALFARSFQLPDLDGKLRTLNDFNGKVTWLIFGYTQCPDICPTALSRAAKVLELLGADQNKVQVAFITLDPERDTPSLLKEYLANFNKNIIGLVGSSQQVKQTAEEYKMFYAKVAGSKADNYSVDHGTMNYIYDKNGKLRLIANHDLTASQISADIKKIIAK